LLGKIFKIFINNYPMKKVVGFTLFSILTLAFFGCSDNQDSQRKKPLLDNHKKVKIGSQTWMTENLDVTKFRNGETIPEAETVDEWNKAGKSKQPAWCYYENDKKNGAKYGKMYNYYAVIDPRGLAPEGWRIPNATDWKKLETKLGKNPGEKMKSTNEWEAEGNGTNESQFNALPGGYRDYIGKFYFKGQNGYWWILSEAKAKSVSCCNLNFKYDFLIRVNAVKANGFSIRCIKE
jgi:uncharacterized protein (TIGR02145 family)